jgi:two-component system sensor histidine kinase and response regulator WspE
VSSDDLSNFSMADLFRVEAESQTAVMVEGLLALERDPRASAQLEALMRAAHSLKGAARIVDLGAAVRVAHAMEDCFVAAQKGALVLGKSSVDLLLKGVDLLTRIAQTPEPGMVRWSGEGRGEIDAFLADLQRVMSGQPPVTAVPVGSPQAAASAADLPVAAPAVPATAPAPETVREAREASDRVLRVTAEHLNRLLGLAGESLVESRWLNPFGDSLLRLKRLHFDLGKALDTLRNSLAGEKLHEDTQAGLVEAQHKLTECRNFLTGRLAELDMFDRRSVNLSHRLYSEALACRMRPFADGIQGFPRMVRDVARSLGREVRLEIIGSDTQVDRDILEKLEAPLGHLLRNAVDHGLEDPAARTAAGKPAEGVVRLEARHSAGMLLIIVSDDGRGVNLEALREAIVRKKLTNEETASRLSEAELLEFLFLPGFTTRDAVTDISGRGVGLDVVQTMIKQVRGTVRVTSQWGKGMRFQLQMPLTLSVMRALLVEVAGEPYAFPLAYITRTIKLPKSRIESMEGREHFRHDGRQIGLVTVHQVLDRGEMRVSGDVDLPVLVVGDEGREYGVIVDRFLGERELVVQPLDARLGKIKDISAAALAEDGSPVLIVDVDDLVRSVEKLVSGGRLSHVERSEQSGQARARKRVLVVDDSLTVRELERKLLESRGYAVEISVDGMDGWNAVRTGQFNLVVTDVDMPRMDGIELVKLIKNDPNLKALPVMIVSYKDREEDRRRGLDAGADYYLTKGSFHDETLIQAVVDLIGDAQA